MHPIVTRVHKNNVCRKKILKYANHSTLFQLSITLSRDGKQISSVNNMLTGWYSKSMAMITRKIKTKCVLHAKILTKMFVEQYCKCF